MTRAAALAALSGGDVGRLVAGVSWVLPDEIVETTRSLSLDFAFVAADNVDAAELVAELHSLDAAAVWAVPGVLGRVAESLGWVEVLRFSVSEPGSLAVPLAEALHDALESARAGVSAGADCVLVADDLAGATGPLVSPDYALDALLPCYRSIASEVSGGAVAAFHSDGDVRVLMPALAHAGYSAVHVAGIGRDGVTASARAAKAVGMVAIGGIVAVEIGVDPVGIGSFAGRLACEEGALVCDDGGLMSPDDLRAFGIAVDAARDAFAERQARA